MKKFKILFLIPIVLFSSCINDDFVYKNTKEANLEALWEIIDTRYCYLDYKGIDWKAVKEKYSADLAYVNNDVEFFDLLGDMLNELKDGHVNLYSSFDISRYSNWYTDYPANYSSAIISDNYITKFRYAGGFRYGIINNDINYKVGYMYYGDFMNSFSNTTIKNIFDSFKDCNALIIDVRNNGGGVMMYSEQLASYFFTEKKVTGYIRHKSGTGHEDFSDYTELVTPVSASVKWDNRPVAVLANRHSYSATNDFVNRMKSASNAIIVGDKTGGGGGMPLSNELPNGWMVRFSACRMYDKDKNDTEWGIEPDFKVDMDESKLAEDAIIDKAIVELKKRH